MSTDATEFTVDEDDSNANQDDSDKPSSTYIQFNEADHPEAYELVKGGGDLREGLGKQTMIKFYAVATKPLAANALENNRIPLLEFANPDPEELAQYIADRDDISLTEDFKAELAEATNSDDSN